IETGNRVDVSYFAQHSLEQLDPEETVFESMEAVASHDAYPKIRPVLGAFGFTDDSVEKSVSVLSGGEKARVALARMLLEPAGCLLFDEPTNHLDIPSCQVLEQALQEFEGAVCIISHDRYFLNNVVNKVVRVDDGALTTYSGDYDYYQYKFDRRHADVEEETPDESDDASEGGGVSKKERRRIRAELRRERREETAELRESIDAIESRIDELEERKDAIEEKLADPSTYDGDDDLEELNREFGEIESELMELMVEWEEKGAQLEEIREEYEERARERCEQE
ncbi:MAG: ATP-binding cassette domain-containing protein, partial [Bradymonadaceae bacterium]